MREPREAGIVLVSRPPERGSRSLPSAAAGCCCCCCCCCLHTIGGLIGAGLGSSSALPVGPRAIPGLPPPPERTEAEVKGSLESARRAVPTYWLTLAALTLITCVVTPFLASSSDRAIITLLVVGLGLPGLQLLASLLAFLVIVLGPFPDRGAAGERLGMITLKAFLGALLGTAIMGAGLLVIWLMSKG